MKFSDYALALAGEGFSEQPLILTCEAVGDGSEMQTAKQSPHTRI